MSATLVVEDGTGLENSNTYVASATLTTYATDRGKTISGVAADLLIQAKDYMESLQYKGIKNTRDQALQFPRTGVVIDGYTLDSDVIPQAIKNAQCEIAIAIDEGNDPSQDLPQKAVRKKVGDLEIEYSPSSSAVTLNRKIKLVLWRYLDGSGNSNVIAVGKG